MATASISNPILPWTPFIPHRPHKKQLAAMLLPHKELLFGGAAGGGKSDWLLMSALQYVDVPGYSAVILRKSYSDLEQEEALLTRAHEWLDEWKPYVHYSAEHHAFTFPSGAVLAFGYIGEFRASERYQGAAFQFCLEKNETIRMADGTLKPIGKIKIGERVITLEGPRKVTYVSPKLVKECVRATNKFGSQIQSLDHRILTSHGWISASNFSKRFCVSDSTVEFSKQSSSVSPMLDELSRKDQQPFFVSSLRDRRETPRPDFCASSASLGNDFSTYYDSLPKVQQLQELSDLSKRFLLAQPLKSYDQNNFGRFDVRRDASFCQSALDYLDDYPSVSCFDDGRSLDLSDNVLACLPSLDGADGSFQRHSRPDALANTQLHSRPYSVAYSHPYTKVARLSSVACNFSPLSFSYTGIQEVVDIRIEGASHYISSSNFVNSNCGFDELTQHFMEDYLYLFSRVRRKKCDKHGGRMIDGKRAPLPYDPDCRLCRTHEPISRIPLRIRSTCNPGGIGHQWVKDRFNIHQNAEGQWIGGDPKRPFMPSRIEDNPSLDLEEYNEMLMEMDPLTREQLRWGYWGAPENSRFKYAWFGRFEKSGDRILVHPNNRPAYQIHQSSLQIFITTDPAASAREGIAGVRFHQRVAPSHAVISVWGVTPSADLLMLDMDRMQTESPEYLMRVKAMVKIWKPAFVECEAIGVGLPIYQSLSAMGIPTEPLRAVPDKIANAVTAQVRCEQGKVFLPRHSIWLKDFEDEVFVWTGHPHQTADIVDTLSNAARQVTRLAGEDQFDPFCGSQIAEAHEFSGDIPFGY